MAANNTAYPINPIPVTSPAPIARNMAHISFAEPGTDLNLTRLNAPATATPAPTLPFTIMITTHTTAGISANVTRKLCVYLLLNAYTPARNTPITRDTVIVVAVPNILSNNPVIFYLLLSMFATLSFK